MKIIIKTDKLPAEVGSIGKIRVVTEGIGEIKKNSVIIKKSEITELEFIPQDHQNQQ